MAPRASLLLAALATGCAYTWGGSGGGGAGGGSGGSGGGAGGAVDGCGDEPSALPCSTWACSAGTWMSVPVGDGAPCALADAAGTCSKGVCVECLADVDCGPGLFCAPGSGLCVACLDDAACMDSTTSHCEPGGTCVACVTDAHCVAPAVCCLPVSIDGCAPWTCHVP